MASNSDSATSLITAQLTDSQPGISPHGGHAALPALPPEPQQSRHLSEPRHLTHKSGWIIRCSLIRSQSLLTQWGHFQKETGRNNG